MNEEKKDVIVYSTPSCPYCVMAKDFLKDNNVIFEDIDVSKDHIRAQEMITKSGQMGVPVLDVKGNIIVGFQPKLIAEFLGL